MHNISRRLRDTGGNERDSGFWDQVSIRSFPPSPSSGMSLKMWLLFRQREGISGIHVVGRLVSTKEIWADPSAQLPTALTGYETW